MRSLCVALSILAMHIAVAQQKPQSHASAGDTVSPVSTDTMTDAEKLQLENYQLKMALLRAQASDLERAATEFQQHLCQVHPRLAQCSSASTGAVPQGTSAASGPIR